MTLSWSNLVLHASSSLMLLNRISLTSANDQRVLLLLIFASVLLLKPCFRALANDSDEWDLDVGVGVPLLAVNGAERPERVVFVLTGLVFDKFAPLRIWMYFAREGQLSLSLRCECGRLLLAQLTHLKTISSVLELLLNGQLSASCFSPHSKQVGVRLQFEMPCPYIPHLRHWVGPFLPLTYDSHRTTWW